MKTFFRATFPIVCATVLLLGCNSYPKEEGERAMDTRRTSPQSQSASDTRTADEAAVRQADIAWSKTGETKDLQASLTFYTNDPIPIMMPPNGPMVVGKEAILRFFQPIYETPGFSVKWEPVEVEVARSGDIGYVRGVYESTVNDSKGNPRSDKGKYIEIWKKQADGSWKVALEIFNSDSLPDSESQPFVSMPSPSGKK